MSRRTDGGNELKLDLKLNLSPQRTQWPVTESPNRSSPITVSPTNSCVSLELAQDEMELRYSSSPETTSMMLAGCPRCLMYVMLAQDFPKCPKCKSTVLLDVVLDKPIKKWEISSVKLKFVSLLVLLIYFAAVSKKKKKMSLTSRISGKFCFLFYCYNSISFFCFYRRCLFYRWCLLIFYCIFLCDEIWCLMMIPLLSFFFYLAWI